MAFKKVSKKKKGSGLPPDVEEAILAMKPEELMVEATIDRNAIEVIKEEKKNDEQILQLKEKIKGFDSDLISTTAVIKAKVALEEAIEDNMSDEHRNAKEDLSALVKGYGNDLKERKKKLKFMDRTIKRHIETG